MSSMAAFANLGAVSEPTNLVVTPSIDSQLYFEFFLCQALILGLAVRGAGCMNLAMSHLRLQYAVPDQLPQISAELHRFCDIE